MVNVSTLPSFDNLVTLVVTESLMRNPSLVELAINDDGSFPRWATNHSKQQLHQLLSSFDKEMDVFVLEVVNDFLAGSIGLAEALKQWRLLSLPFKLRQFAVCWQAKLDIYLLSRAGLVSTLLE